MISHLSYRNRVPCPSLHLSPLPSTLSPYSTTPPLPQAAACACACQITECRLRYVLHCTVAIFDKLLVNSRHFVASAEAKKGQDGRTQPPPTAETSTKTEGPKTRDKTRLGSAEDSKKVKRKKQKEKQQKKRKRAGAIHRGRETETEDKADQIEIERAVRTVCRECVYRRP